MKSMTKVALITASVLSVGALTACQSTSSTKEQSRMMHGEYKHRMSPEQREKMQQMRAQHQEFRDQAQNACDGKAVGQAVQIKAGEKTIDGTCNTVFIADEKTREQMRQDFRRVGAEQGKMYRQGARMQDMTEEQRVQVKQQFEQKRAERQTQMETIQKSCEGQANGKTVQVKIGEKTLSGTCVVKFQPQNPIQQNVTPTAPAATTAS